MGKPEELKIKPYARLLTMLGEQLIKNERIALIELIKNCYDADSPWVKITFKNFGKNFSIGPTSSIIIEDAGEGMDEDIIRNHLVHPATPEKKLRKALKPKTKKGRYIQGEKGIGRFAILKLGRKINITTKKKSEDIEHVVDYDFANYDDEFLKQNGQPKEIFLDSLSVSYQVRSPKEFVTKKIKLGSSTLNRPSFGTRIEISNLKGSWTSKKIEKAYYDVARLQPLFLFESEDSLSKSSKSKPDKFNVYLYDDDEQVIHADVSKELHGFMENNAVLKYEGGQYIEAEQKFEYKINGKEFELPLNDAHAKGLKDVSEHFQIDKDSNELRASTCGDFEFELYIFDFSNKVDEKFALAKPEKDLIKEHRIYLYRDGVRVYPYGEPDDDWLKIDMYRGTISAGHYLSNDQVLGYINISHKHNPKLMDKTNREGLIESGQSLDDFQALLQILLAHIRQKDYKKYQIDSQRKRESTNAVDVYRENKIKNAFSELKKFAKSEEQISGKKTLKKLEDLSKDYDTEKKYLEKRAETTEELAGVGLSVETTSHDIMSMLDKTVNRLDGLIKDCMGGDLDSDIVSNELNIIRGQVGFIESQMKGIQSLFKSSKQRRKNVRVSTLLEKVEKIYRRILKEENVCLEVNHTGSPLVAKTTDAVLLQVLINLFDNSIYWLRHGDSNNKKIQIELNGDDGTLVFSDNGPGIIKSDISYLFEPFFSGKGEEGRGLGLYIARQLLRRHEYEIELASLKSEKKLSGANFVISFIREQ